MGITMTFHELLTEHRRVLSLCDSLEPRIDAIATLLRATDQVHGKVVTCGNGGSFAHAQHLATELVVRYRMTREPMRAIALGSNGAITTAVCNDLDPRDIFYREAAAIVDTNDCLVAFSTSGRSPNVLKTIELFRGQRLPVVGITGIHGMATPVDYELRVPSDTTSIIQQIHTLVIHALCEKLDA